MVLELLRVAIELLRHLMIHLHAFERLFRFEASALNSDRRHT